MLETSVKPIKQKTQVPLKSKRKYRQTRIKSFDINGPEIIPAAIVLKYLKSYQRTRGG